MCATSTGALDLTRIQDHCTFDEYMDGQHCPWSQEFQQEWDSGKLARAVPGLVFHPEDKTYSRIMSQQIV